MIQPKNPYKKIFYRLSDRYFRMTAIYICLISIFIGCAVLFTVYRISIRNIEMSSLHLCRTKIGEFKNILETNIRQADNAAISLCQDDDAFQLGYLPFMDETDRVRKIFNLRDRIANIMHMNGMLYSAYIYYKDKKQVISDALFTDDSYYDTRFVHDDKVSGIGLVITKDDGTMAYLMGGPPDTTSVFKIIRKHFNGAVPIYAVVNIRTDVILNLIDRMLLNEGGSFYILDSQGNVILSDKNAPAYDKSLLTHAREISDKGGKKYITVGQTSDYTGWQLLYTVPLESIHSGYKAMFIYMTVIFMIMLALGLVLGTLAAIKIQKPVNLLHDSIRRKLDGNKHASIGEADRMKYLNHAYESIFNDNRKLSEIMEKNLPHLREQFLMGMLLHRNKPDENIMENMNQFSVSFPYGLFMVAAVEIRVQADNVDKFEYLKAGVCRDYMEKKLEGIGRYDALMFEPNRIAFILNYAPDKTNKGHVFYTLSEAAGELGDKLDTDISIGVSCEGTGISSLSTLFMQALKALEYKFLFGKNEILYFDHMDYIATASPAYPFDLEQKLAGAITACDRAEIGCTLGHLKNYSLTASETNVFAYRQIFLYMIGNIRKILLDMIDPSNIGTLEDFFKNKSEWKIQSVPEYISYIEEISLKAVEYIELRKKSKNTEIAEAVVRYIHENYSRNITVEDIAYAVYISVPYLYKLMKEEKDLSPVNYINHVRLCKAAEKLEDLHRQIKDISAECGFESIQTFNRQFKRFMNCSPSEYREKFRKV